MATRPKEVLLPTGDELAVLWDDGHESYFPAPLLRRECPCAICRSSRGDSNPLRILSGPAAAATGPPEIASWDPVGRYALHLVWNDGHQTGIYPFPLLRDLCPCEECRRGKGAAS